MCPKDLVSVNQIRAYGNMVINLSLMMLTSVPPSKSTSRLADVKMSRVVLLITTMNLMSLATNLRAQLSMFQSLYSIEKVVESPKRRRTKSVSQNQIFPGL